MTEIMAVRWDDLLELLPELSSFKFDIWPIAEAVLLSEVPEAEGDRDSVLGCGSFRSMRALCLAGCEDVGRGALGTQDGGRGSWPRMGLLSSS